MHTKKKPAARLCFVAWSTFSPPEYRMFFGNFRRESSKYEIRGESSKYEVRGFFGEENGFGDPFPVLCDGTPDAMRCASYGIFYFKDDIVT
jgi:hypothetical protein